MGASVDPESGFCAHNGVYYSKREFVPLPQDPCLTLPSFLFHIADKGAFHARTLYIDFPTGRRISYGRLHSLIDAASSGMAQHLGLRKGDVLLLLSPNSIEFSVLVLAAMSAGIVVTTCNPLNTPAEISKQASESGAALVATVPSLLPKIAPLKLPCILIVEEDNIESNRTGGGGGEKRNGMPNAPFTITFRSLLSSNPSDKPARVIKQDDIAALLYSSGTTGTSKGVMISHKNLIAQAAFFLCRKEGLALMNRVYLCIIPMFHAYGLAMFCSATVASGCQVVVLPKYHIQQMLVAIEKHRVTHIMLVPPMMLDLASSSKVEGYDLSSLFEVSVGAAPISSAVITAFRARFPNVRIMQGYALTESTSVGANTITQKESERHSSVGLLAPNMEARIVDIDLGKYLPPNLQGEIWLRGPVIMQGYFGKPGETASIIDEEGWLHTGDLGYFDALGHLYVVDRLKELIKYKGYQVAPAELEAMLLSHPLITDAAVIPFPDDQAGQIPMAYVVPAYKNAISDKDVISFVAQQVAPYKKIRKVEMVDSIPKSPAGKILRRQLVIRASSKL